MKTANFRKRTLFFLQETTKFHSPRILFSLAYTFKAKMCVRLIYENGKGEVVDESGNMHFEMDIDTEAYPID